MYRIRYGNILLHDPRDEECVLSDAECEIAVNDAGTLKFTMPRHHPMHGLLKPMDKDQEVVLENDGYEMFRGRVLSIEEGFHGGGLVTCEGELAYLNDVLLRPYSTTEPGVPSSVDGYFAWLVSEYNKQTDERFRFVVGINQGYELDPNNYILRENRNYPTIGQEMKDKLVGKLGGYIRIRHEGGLRYIDYIASGDNASSQRIEFGENLIDFTHERDWSEYRTVVVPVGKAPEGSDRKLDVSGEPNAPLAGGLSKIGDRIVDDAAVREFGYIEQVVEFDDVTIASNLVQSGARWLRNVRIGDTLTMTAIDLSDIDPNLKPIFIGDFVRATSRPHGFDEYFVCSKLTIKVSNPDGNTFVLGNEYGYMTGKQAEKIAELNASINKVYSETVAISGEAKQTAQQAKDAAEKAEAVDKIAKDAQERADAAQGSADKAQADADAAKLAADAARAEADKAFADATQAAADALAAKRKADEATAKVEVAESEMTVVKQAVAGAEAASSAAQLAAGEASTKADGAQTAATEAKASAGTAIQNAATAIATADAATAQAAGAKADAAQVRTDLAGQIKTVTDTMAADYTKKTDLTLTESRLMSEIERSAAGVTSTVAQQYAKKTDLSTVQADLQTKITQNAEAITSTAASVTAVDTKANNAQSAADAAKTAAAKAQTDATAAAGNAAAAQSAADAAAANLAAAEANLDAVSIRVGATEADVAAAELAVKNAKAAADAAAASASTAKTSAATAQATADAAKSAAAKAQSAADALGVRVTATETKITQSADEIALRATKTEVDTAKAAAIGAAAADAKTKADAALAGAKTYADAQIKVSADNITSTVSKTYATQTSLAATDTKAANAASAASTAQSTANTAKANAATAQTGVNGLTTRMTEAESSITQQADSIALRATKTEVATAKSEAVSAAATDATTKANNAKSAAVSAAASDATTKANNALANAKTYADAQIKVQADRITASVSETTALGARMTTVEQTASGLSVSLESVESTANTAKTTADTAKSTANTARTEAANAAKTASDYMQYTADGLEVGNRSSGAWSGLRSRMAAGAFEVLDAAGNVLSSFGASVVELGKNSVNSAIELCHGAGRISGFGTEQLRGLSLKSSKLSLSTKAPSESGYSLAPRIEIDESGVYLNSSGVASISGKTVIVNGYDVKLIRQVKKVSFGSYQGSFGQTYTRTEAITGFSKPPIAIPADSGWCVVRSVSIISTTRMTFELDCVANTLRMSASFYLIEFI